MSAQQMAHERMKQLEAAYRWKAENIVRFLDQLTMTTMQKEDFVARELASVHWVVEVRGRVYAD